MSNTLQTMFAVVCDHLMAQGERSVLYKNYSNPAYWGLDGKKCAVGVLLKGAAYSRSLEGHEVVNERVVRALRASDWPIDDVAVRNLVLDLQIVHDEHQPNEWPTLLETIGRDHGLEIPASVRAALEPKGRDR